MPYLTSVSWKFQFGSDEAPIMRDLLLKFAPQLRLVFLQDRFQDFSSVVIESLNLCRLTKLEIALPSVGKIPAATRQLCELPLPNLTLLVLVLRQIDEYHSFLESMPKNMPRLTELLLQLNWNPKLSWEACGAIKQLAWGKPEFCLRVNSAQPIAAHFSWMESQTIQFSPLKPASLWHLEEKLMDGLGLGLAQLHVDGYDLWTSIYVQNLSGVWLALTETDTMERQFRVSCPFPTQRVAALTSFALALASVSLHKSYPITWKMLTEWLHRMWEELEPVATFYARSLEKHVIPAAILTIYGLDICFGNEIINVEAKTKCEQALEQCQGAGPALLDALYSRESGWLRRGTIDLMLTCCGGIGWRDSETGRMKSQLPEVTRDMWEDFFHLRNTRYLLAHATWNDQTRLASGEFLCQLLLEAISADLNGREAGYAKEFESCLEICVRVGLRDGRWEKFGSQWRMRILKSASLRQLIIQYLPLGELASFKGVRHFRESFWGLPKCVARHRELLQAICEDGHSTRFEATGCLVERFRSRFVSALWLYLLKANVSALRTADSWIAELENLCPVLPTVIVENAALPRHVLQWIKVKPEWRSQYLDFDKGRDDRLRSLESLPNF